MLWVRISIRVRCTTLCDKVCQWFTTDQWFSLGPPVLSTNKTGAIFWCQMICLFVQIVCMSPTSTWISKVIYHGLFVLRRFEVRGDCWYWCNCWSSLLNSLVLVWFYGVFWSPLTSNRRKTKRPWYMTLEIQVLVGDMHTICTNKQIIWHQNIAKCRDGFT
jgi:hypothetical protein